MPKKELQGLVTNVSLRETGTTRSGHVRKSLTDGGGKKKVDFTDKTIDAVLDKALKVSLELSQEVAKTDSASGSSVPPYVYHYDCANITATPDIPDTELLQLSPLSNTRREVEAWLSDSQITQNPPPSTPRTSSTEYRAPSTPGTPCGAHTSTP